MPNVFVIGNPVEGRIHAPSWQRPEGNHEFRMTQDFGPTSLKAEPRVIWPGGEGISPGVYAHFHKGIDLGNRHCGDPVIAAKAGTIKAAGPYVYTDGGVTYRPIRVVIGHGDGWTTEYWHLADEKVSVGQAVARGQVIGHVGSTGNSTACHLHFVLRRFGLYRDPWRRLAQNVAP